MRNHFRFCIALIITVLVGLSYFTLQRTHAQSGCTTSPLGIVAWYPGDGNANDIARINHGTVHGNVTYATGKVGQAFSSDGNFSGISLGNPEQLRSQTFTIEAWVKRASTTKATVDSSDSGLIFGYGLQGYGFYLKNDGHLAFGKIGSYEILSVASGNLPDLAITDTNFHHVAVTRSTASMTFYLDGVQGRATPLDDQFEFTTNAAIGARGDNFQNSFFGSIDEATVYNRALTQPEIQGVFNAAAAGKCEATSVQLEHAAYPTNSISSTVTINVARTGNTAGASSVNYATVNGTAKAGQDYTNTSGTLSFSPGEQLKPISVPILNNPAQTGDVSFNLALSGASGSALGSPASATVNIFYSPAGPGRIMVPGGDLYSDYTQAYNLDGTNNFHITEYRYGTHLRYPSVARLTGTIAFQGCGEFTPTGTCDKAMRIFTMNGDGSGFRQVTNEQGLDDPQFQPDIRPVISPDGTKIAFISERPTAHYGVDEAFVVNTDGTNLHQVTTHQNVPNVGESRAYSVVWSPDSQKLLVHASRLGKDINGTDTFLSSLYTYNPDGTGETLVQRGLFNAPIALDWSPDGKTILYPAVGQIVFGYVLVDALNPEHTTFLSGQTLSGNSPNFANISSAAGSVRFSPDSRKIVYGDGQETSIRTVNLDGTNVATVVTNSPYYFEEKYWWPGAAIPKPDHLTLTPNPLSVFGTQPAQATPTLYDAQNNIIFHSAGFDIVCDQQHPCTGGVPARVTAMGLVYNADVARTGVSTLCGSNAGFQDCALVSFGIENVGVTTSTPVIRKSGADGAGVLKIKRSNTNANSTSLLVQFTLGGAGVRGTDYFLADAAGNRINSNAFTIPPGQSSLDLKVVPIISPSTGDKDVKLTILTDNVNYNYVADGTNAIGVITIKDDHPDQAVLTLTVVTPNKGGDTGGVTATVFGANIRAGASVKLTRNGQADINGTNTSVAANGTSLNTTFDLTGKGQGVWSVVVTNPDNSAATLAGAFTVEAGGAASVWVDVVGRYTMRSNLTQKFFIAYGNTANVDSQPTLFHLVIPKELTVVTLPILPGGDVPVIQVDSDSTTTLEFTVPAVAANSATYLPIQLKASNVHIDVEIQAWSLTSPALAQTLTTPVPTATRTLEIVDQTATHQKSIIHVSDSSGTYDVTDETTVTQVAQPETSTFARVEVGDNVEYRYTWTTPNTAAANVRESKSGSRAKGVQPQDNGTSKSSRKVILKTHNETDFLDGDTNAHRNWNSWKISRKDLIACLRAKGLINPPLLPDTHDFLDDDAKGDVILLSTLTTRFTNITNSITSQELTLEAIHPSKNFDSQLLSRLNSEKLDAHQRQLLYDAKSFVNPHGAEALLLLSLLKDCDCPPKGQQGNLLDGTRFAAASCPTCPAAEACTSGVCKECDDSRRKINMNVVASGDPNEKDGPPGGGAQHYITGQEPLRYTISFENKPEATAPAQTVVVTDQLDTTKVDLSTFNLGAFSFGDRTTFAPQGFASYTTDVDLRPAKSLIVHINAQLNQANGLVTWRFTSIDPATGQPTADPLAGFLPPDKKAPEGQGGVTFSVSAKPGIASGTQISNKATIVFDNNAPIDTNAYVNTVDNSNPTSSVTALSPSQPVHSFLVKWSGADTGSGLRDYSVFVSINGGPFNVWLADTTDTSAYFYGDASASYAFYSIARDLAGNIQTAKTAADTATTTTTGNPIDDSQWFVRQHYLDFLGREPDAPGLQFWVDNIEVCGADTQCREAKRINTSAAFFLSIEFQNTGFLAYRINKAAFGNLSGKPVPVTRSLFNPDAEEMADTPFPVIVGREGWEQQLAANKVAFTQDFVARSEFISLYPTTLSPAQFVDALFTNAGVTPTAAERQAAIGEFGSAANTSEASARARSLRDVAENPAFTSAEFSRTFVLMQYFGYLRRDPNATPDSDFAGYNFWLNKLNQFGGNYINAEMGKAFINSSEYRKRFGQP